MRLRLLPSLFLALTACSAASAGEEGVKLPAPVVDARPAATGDATAVFGA